MNIRKIIYMIFKPKSYFKLSAQRRFLKKSKYGIEKYQLERIRSIVHYCYNNNEFYRSLWDKNGVDVDIDSLEDFKKFPLISKDMLREARYAGTLISIPYRKKRLHIDYTTGSSGEPFEVVKDSKCYAIHFTDFVIAMERYGYKLGCNTIRLWRGNLKGSIFDGIKFFLTGKKTICIYDPKKPAESRLTPERINKIILELESSKPVIIDGFVSALVLISNYILNNNINVFLPNLVSVATGAEPLSNEDRETISKAFNVPVFNRYGGTEFGLLGQECEVQSTSEEHALHISDYKSLVEVSEQTHEIIVTDLYNHAMPLIRYETGDHGELSLKHCGCGEMTSMFKSIDGRLNDMLLLEDGSFISSHIWHNYFKKYSWVQQYQIVQLDIGHFEIRISTKYETLNEDQLIQLKDRVDSALMSPLLIEWKVGEDVVEVGVGGKYKQCLNLVKQS